MWPIAVISRELQLAVEPLPTTRIHQTTVASRCLCWFLRPRASFGLPLPPLLFELPTCVFQVASSRFYVSSSYFDVFPCHSDVSSRHLQLAMELLAKFLGLAVRPPLWRPAMLILSLCHFLFQFKSARPDGTYLVS
jgi:hypothetical protein